MEKLRYEVQQAQYAAARERLFYDQERDEQQERVNGRYIFNRGVTRKSVERLLERMETWHRHDPYGDWYIRINSFGGEEFAAYCLIDELRAHSRRCMGSHEITIAVRGHAASAAGMILQAADHRVIGKYSSLMIHKGAICMEGDIGVDDLVQHSRWMRERVDLMANLFLERGTISRAEFMKKIRHQDWWVSAQEAVGLGFADAIG